MTTYKYVNLNLSVLFPSFCSLKSIFKSEKLLRIKIIKEQVGKLTRVTLRNVSQQETYPEEEG